MMAKGYRVSFMGNENVLKLIVMMNAQLFDNTKDTQLFILNGQIVWDVNYVSIKLLF